MITDCTTLAGLGPAQVIRVDERAIHVLSDGQERLVTMAMPIRYHPRVGDVLLVAATAEACYAIGVLTGTGNIELASSGDVTVQAGGRLRLQAGEAIAADGPELRLTAGRMEFTAKDLVANAQSFLQRIAGLLHLSAGRRHIQVEGSSVEHARQVVVKAQETVTIDGSTIHLG